MLTFKTPRGETACVVDGQSVDQDGSTTFTSGGDPVLRRNPDGTFDELRVVGPFHQLLPCPRCGSADGYRHEPLKHVDPRLGVKWPP